MAVSRVGKLKNQITLQNTNLTTDNVGGYTTGNTTFITSFAKITPKGGKEIFTDTTGRQIENPHTYEFMIRYRPNITTAMRILYGTRTFNIIKISDENDNNNYITIEAIENVGT
jgi:SPP1 family predicted phage head-tail adaptor